MERHDEIEPYLAAYRAREARRWRSPFTDPRIAQIAADRAARAATPWYRRLLVHHPAPAFASSALALALLVAPAALPSAAPMAERAGAPTVMGDMTEPAAVASPLMESITDASVATGTIELLPALLAAAAVAGALEGVRRIRATRG